MKICFLLGGFYSGGIGRVVSILANELCKNEKNEIHAVTLRPAAKQEIYHLDKRIKRAYLVEDTRPVKYVFILALKKYKEYIACNDIDISIACGNIFYLFALLSKSKKTRVICWEHSNVYSTTDNQGQTMFRWIASKFADEIVTLTDCDKNGYIEKFGAKKIRRIYNPIDPQLQDGDTAECKLPYIISVGRLCYQKNFEVIPDIAKNIKTVCEDWRWDVFGTGDSKEQIQNKIDEYGLTERVVLKGQVSDLYDRYKEYSMIVMTSRYEGFPMTLLEGMSKGLPLLSYDIKTGPDEIIVDGKNGYLVDAGDVSGMADKIASLLNNLCERKRMSTGSIEKAKEFDVRTIVAQWEALFNEKIEGSMEKEG